MFTVETAKRRCMQLGMLLGVPGAPKPEPSTSPTSSPSVAPSGALPSYSPSIYPSNASLSSIPSNSPSHVFASLMPVTPLGHSADTQNSCLREKRPSDWLMLIRNNFPFFLYFTYMDVYKAFFSNRQNHATFRDLPPTKLQKPSSGGNLSSLF
jgi:hypothetical protein